MIFKKTENIIVIGIGRLGAYLAGTLSERGFRVIAVDKLEDSFRKLPDNFSGYKVIGDGTDVNILKMADIENAYMVIVTTNKDNVNSLAAQIASRIYGIKQVYTRLNDIDKEKLIDGFNINVIYPFNLSIAEFNRLSSINI